MFIQALKEQLGEASLSPGEVAIVGAGPGDPGLLTLRALCLLNQADCLVYDRLVSPDVMALAPQAAQRFYVGKASRCHALTQDETNQLLVRLAVTGKRVVRLKGGDPFIFGRGGEEAEMLVDNGIPFRVVPGITSAQGCSAYAGFPLTHRDYAQGVTFVTGHARADGSLNLDWPALASRRHTLVFYMGLTNAELIRQELLANGMPSRLPVALIERGTTPQQRRIITTLDRLPDTIRDESLTPPTLIVVGEVVSLAARLDAGCLAEAVA
ncbi:MULTISPECIES: uroporphyrinogen-III C-methyltransferase [Halomonas]|uniref:uroporphyrinogen-III C-methyltransferase n=1 Tax=Halomonas TaxID=2745 RepID=UPI001C940D01|nr:MULTISPECIES: uroporphyrinogen-III C-methyltransferase [Halomonas]MBY6206065.1 uroporphyrinogen-III C-methyltransferase [Halomonas sp. DP3Y7-2]MBY6228044.1 uroporphyrinogen-III C-methyltransferase [Halomonas sp. DP3Y7-1]MCA0916111.1 uroporphyrinogen-III C-methyltransferase [Halomonas denitrificans]